jgi:RNA polymerase sigma-70 factor, ECF subfamily
LFQRAIGLLFQTFDAAYIARLRAGDANTAEHFASYFGELIRLKLRSRLNSPEAIEDVRQETLARVLASLHKDNGPQQPERFGAYVNSVCNNVLLEHYRSVSRSRADSIEENESAMQFSSSEPDALHQLLSQSEVRVVREILEKLGDRDRRILRSLFLEEKDKDEICREMGIDREYMRVLLHRAKQSFKAVYIKHSGVTRLSIPKL